MHQWRSIFLRLITIVLLRLRLHLSVSYILVNLPLALLKPCHFPLCPLCILVTTLCSWYPLSIPNMWLLVTIPFLAISMNISIFCCILVNTICLRYPCDYNPCLCHPCDNPLSALSPPLWLPPLSVVSWDTIPGFIYSYFVPGKM